MNDQHANRATLVLADISGYTGFLAAVGSAHRAELELGEAPPAYPLMTTLLDAIVQSLTPPFVLASWRVTRSFRLRRRRHAGYPWRRSDGLPPRLLRELP